MSARRASSLYLVGVAVWISTQSVGAQTRGSADRYWYVGGGISITDAFIVSGTGFDEASDRGDSDTGLVLSGGYRWSRHMALEVGYLDGGRPSIETITALDCPSIGPCLVDVEQDTTAIEVGVLAILPLRGVWEPYLKGGAAFWSVSGSQLVTPLLSGAATTRSLDADGTDFMLGVGIGVTLRERAHLRLEYQAFRTDDDLLALDPSREARFDQLSLELHWRF